MSALPPSSPFSQAVFKLIRPSIPRERWPNDPVRATFEPGMDGYYLIANFDGFPQSYANLATRLVVEAGVDLVVVSPAARAAAAVTRAKRWRDACLYSAAPTLFAIPMLGMLADALMKLAAAAFALDAILLVATQISLSHSRGALAGTRFVAEIPMPGYRLQVAASGIESSAPAPHPQSP